MIVTDQIVSQLSRLIMRYNRALRAVDQRDGLPARQATGLLASVRAAIARFSPPGSAYLMSYQEISNIDCSDDYRLSCLMGIVDALRHDYSAGALAPIQELIRAEVFDDFLEMADHLLELGYKDPAAVLTGGVLEQQLRKLSSRAGIPTEKDGKPKKVDALNSELAAKGVYGKLDQKNVTSWLDLRNKAAHAEYTAYTPEQVRLTLLGVRDFLRRASS